MHLNHEHVVLRTIKKIPSLIFIMLIQGLRPFLGPAECKFPVTCTRFAIIELQEKPLASAIYSIIKRLLACNPFF